MKGKALEPERNAAARAFVKKIVDGEFAGNTSAAAAAFGISQSLLYEFLGQTRGAGMKLLGAVAAYTKRPIDDIIGLTPSVPTQTADPALDVALAYHGRAAFAERAVLAAIAEAEKGARRSAPDWADYMTEAGKVAVLADRAGKRDTKTARGMIAGAKTGKKSKEEGGAK